MAEFLTVVGAVKTAVDFSFIIWNFTKRFRNLSFQLFCIHEDLKTDLLGLDYWMRTFKVKRERSDIYFETIFGEKGWREIRMILGGIEKITKDITDGLSDIVDRALWEAGIAHRSARAGSRENRRLLEDALRRISRGPSFGRKLKSVLLNAPGDLELQIKMLDRRLLNLERGTYYYAELQNPGIFGPIPDPGNLTPRIEYPLPTEGAKLQKDARWLAESYNSGEKIKCHVGLALSKPNDHWTAVRRRPRSPVADRPSVDHNLHMLLTDGPDTLEVRVEPVRMKVVGDSRGLRHTVATAFDELKDQPESYLLPPDEPEMTLANGEKRKIGFTMKTSPQHQLEELARLSTVAEHLRNRERLHLTLSDRIGLASSLVDGCFRLLGSDWLNTLEAKNVRGRKIDDGGWISMLNCQILENGRSSTDLVLDEVLSAARKERGRRDLKLPCQIFRLGVLLTELCLNKPITYIEKETRSKIVMVKIRDYDEEPLTATQIADRVEEETLSKGLGDIVHFCLQTLGSEKSMQNEKLWDDFYELAFVP
jgi:hypothetical protein